MSWFPLPLSDLSLVLPHTEQNDGGSTLFKIAAPMDTNCGNESKNVWCASVNFIIFYNVDSGGLKLDGI